MIRITIETDEMLEYADDTDAAMVARDLADDLCANLRLTGTLTVFGAKADRFDVSDGDSEGEFVIVVKAMGQ